MGIVIHIICSSCPARSPKAELSSRPRTRSLFIRSKPGAAQRSSIADGAVSTKGGLLPGAVARPTTGEWHHARAPPACAALPNIVHFECVDMRTSRRVQLGAQLLGARSPKTCPHLLRHLRALSSKPMVSRSCEAALATPLGQPAALPQLPPPRRCPLIIRVGTEGGCNHWKLFNCKGPRAQTETAQGAAGEPAGSTMSPPAFVPAFVRAGDVPGARLVAGGVRA